MHAQTHDRPHILRGQLRQTHEAHQGTNGDRVVLSYVAHERTNARTHQMHAPHTIQHARAPSKVHSRFQGREKRKRNILNSLVSGTLNTLTLTRLFTHVCPNPMTIHRPLTQLLLAWDATSCSARLIHTYGDGTTPLMATLPGKHLQRVLQLGFPFVLPRSAPCVPSIVQATTPTVGGKACVCVKKSGRGKE